MEFLANIHSKIIHFPIAFLILYPIMEILFTSTKKEFFNKAAFLFLIIGVTTALIAVLSGNQAFVMVKYWSNLSREYFNSHQIFASITVWYFAILLVLRYYIFINDKLNRKIAIVFLLLSLLGTYFVFQTGYYGGKFAKQNMTNTILNNKLIN
jgi:uncharacterized membrane protein